jgi:hypothetical protein
MDSTESSPLNDEYPQRDVEASDLDAGHASSDRVHRLRPGTAYRSSGFKNTQFRTDKPSISRRVTRSLARFFLVAFIGVGGTLAWQSYGDEAIEIVRAWDPSLNWLLPAPVAKLPTPVTSAELQEQLRPMALDIALLRRSAEQFAANLDQLARKEEQTAQNVATMQAAEQQLIQKVSSPAPSKPARVPPLSAAPQPAQ